MRESEREKMRERESERESQRHTDSTLKNNEGMEKELFSQQKQRKQLNLVVD